MLLEDEVFKEDPCIIPDCLGKTIFKKKQFLPSKVRTENSPCLLLTWPTSFNKFIFYLSDKKQKIESMSPVFPLGYYPFIQQTLTLPNRPWGQGALNHTSNHRAETTFYMMASSCLRWQWTKVCQIHWHRYLNNSFLVHRECGVAGWHLQYPSLGWRFWVFKINV